MDIPFWLVSIIIGVVIGFIVVSVMKSQLKSVRSNSGASDYIVPGSFNLTVSQDIFLYQRTTRTPKNTNNKK